MNAIQTIQATAATSDMVLKSYVGDLDDADLLKRPHAGCNHVAWQLGHLILAEVRLADMMVPGTTIELPEGFAEAHDKANADCDDASRFHTKDEYLALYEKARAATHQAIESLSEGDLDKPNPNEDWRAMFPTIGSVCVLNATHPMMHVGQFVPVRRELDKPIVI